jgi:hypothetical protein
MTFVWDGKPFETTRLPVKPLLRDPLRRRLSLYKGESWGQMS